MSPLRKACKYWLEVKEVINGCSCTVVRMSSCRHLVLKLQRCTYSTEPTYRHKDYIRTTGDVIIEESMSELVRDEVLC